LAIDVRQPSNYRKALRMLAEACLDWNVLPGVMVTPELVCLPLHRHEQSRTIMLAYHRRVSCRARRGSFSTGCASTASLHRRSRRRAEPRATPALSPYRAG
jgi:hypothetical protein